MPLDRDHTETIAAQRTAWARPEVRRMNAGEAEIGTRAGADALNQAAS